MNEHNYARLVTRKSGIAAPKYDLFTIYFLYTFHPIENKNKPVAALQLQTLTCVAAAWPIACNYESLHKRRGNTQYRTPANDIHRSYRAAKRLQCKPRLKTNIIKRALASGQKNKNRKNDRYARRDSWEMETQTFVLRSWTCKVKTTTLYMYTAVNMHGQTPLESRRHERRRKTRRAV